MAGGLSPLFQHPLSKLRSPGLASAVTEINNLQCRVWHRWSRSFRNSHDTPDRTENVSPTRGKTRDANGRCQIAKCPDSPGGPATSANARFTHFPWDAEDRQTGRFLRDSFRSVQAAQRDLRCPSGICGSRKSDPCEHDASAANRQHRCCRDPACHSPLPCQGKSVKTGTIDSGYS